MRSAPVPDSYQPPQVEVAAEPTPTPAGLARRVGAFLLREFREILPPTIFFLIGFNLVVLTTNLILANYGARFASFLIATASALIVAKALLVANAMPLIRHYDRAPLIRPILFKTSGESHELLARLAGAMSLARYAAHSRPPVSVTMPLRLISGGLQRRVGS